MKKSAAVSGLHIRLDVPTKCKLVEQVLTKTFSTKKEQQEYIESLANQSFVNPVTIKLWCGKYQNTWKLGKELPTGTMSFSFATMADKDFPKVVKQLEDLRSKLANISEKAHTKYYGNLKQADVQKTKTPGEILDELVTTKKAK